MKRIKLHPCSYWSCLTTLLFFSSMKKIEDTKDKFEEPEQVENGVIGGDSFAHAK